MMVRMSWLACGCVGGGALHEAVELKTVGAVTWFTAARTHASSWPCMNNMAHMPICRRCAAGRLVALRPGFPPSAANTAKQSPLSERWRPEMGRKDTQCAFGADAYPQAPNARAARLSLELGQALHCANAPVLPCALQILGPQLLHHCKARCGLAPRPWAADPRIGWAMPAPLPASQPPPYRGRWGQQGLRRFVVLGNTDFFRLVERPGHFVASVRRISR